MDIFEEHCFFKFSFFLNRIQLEIYLFLGVKLTLSSLIEGKNFNQGGHKIGLGLDVEA